MAAILTRDTADSIGDSAVADGESVARPHVAILRWPEEVDTIRRLRAAGTPRLLVVPPDVAAPDVAECDEDWIRMPATDDDIRVRMQTLARRSSRHAQAPVIKGDGRVVFRNRWVAVSATEEAVAAVLAARFGEVVDAETLAASVAPKMNYNSVRVQVLRLRTHFKPLGLEVRSVRGRGYVLEAGEIR
jgi:DNA-binding response OmpR family regulator